MSALRTKTCSTPRPSTIAVGQPTARQSLVFAPVGVPRLVQGVKLPSGRSPATTTSWIQVPRSGSVVARRPTSWARLIGRDCDH